MKTIFHTSLVILFTVIHLASPDKARADLATDLQDILSQTVELQIQLKGTQLSGDIVCAPLVAGSQAARSLLENINFVNNQIAAPVTIDESMLETIEQLFTLSSSLADEAVILSSELILIAPSSDAITIKGGLTAMLQLSDDIGTMADRIGEMSDKILIMADNIGIMADRILLTQEIQSQNLALTQATLLQTQTNVLSLVSVVETASYNLDLNTLVLRGETLAAELAAIIFSPWTIKYQLAAAADDVENFKDQLLVISDIIEADSATSTMIIDDTTLLAINNMAIMVSSIAAVLDGYNLAIGSMVDALTDRNLSASINSMLEMSADIGVMANAILEMADNILSMADNIGLTADQIILAQRLQSDYMAISHAAILTAQETAIALIVAEAL